MMKTKAFAMTAVAMLMGTTALADQFTDAIVANLQDLEYDYIELKTGPSQVKVEAIKGTEKLEVIYDRATGKILKQEMEAADSDEIGRVGLEIDQENRDFLDDDDEDEDDLDDDDDDDDDDDNDDRSGHGGGDHDDDDDRSGHGGGGGDDRSGHGGGGHDDDKDDD